MIATNNAVWIVDSTAGVEKGKLRNEPGLIITKNPGGDLRRETPPPLPNYFHQQLQLTQEMLQYVSGVQDITQKLNNATGPGMQIVAEYTQTRIRGKLQNFETAIQEIGYWAVEMIRAHYEEPRIIRLTSPKENQEPFMTFDASQLKPQIPVTDERGQQVVEQDEQGNLIPMFEEGAVYFDIVVSSGSSMMLNKSAKYQQALELFGAGAYDIESLLEKSELGNPKEILERLIKYGVIKSPDLPQVDMSSILNELGVRFNMTTNTPELISQAISRFQVAEQKANQIQEMKKQGVPQEQIEAFAKEPIVPEPQQMPQGMPMEQGLPPEMMQMQGQPPLPMPQEGISPMDMPPGMLNAQVPEIDPMILQMLQAQNPNNIPE